MVNLRNGLPNLRKKLRPLLSAEKPLFDVRERMFSFSPQDRAQAIADRIQKLSTQPPSQVLPIHVVDYETTTEIAARDLVVMAVTDGDARPSWPHAAGVGRPVCAAHTDDDRSIEKRV